MNIREVDMSKSQQQRFLELIYDNQSVFSLCDEDLGLCDCLKHTIPTTTDKPKQSFEDFVDRQKLDPEKKFHRNTRIFSDDTSGFS